MIKRNRRCGRWNGECGLGPIGAYAYAPAGRRNKKGMRSTGEMGVVRKWYDKSNMAVRIIHSIGTILSATEPIAD
jgi:hypothetical protein